MLLPPGLTGQVAADRRTLGEAFLVVAEAVNGARDISSFGGRRRASRREPKNTPCISLILPQKKGVFRFAKMLGLVAHQ